MIPLRDMIPCRTTPVVTRTLIGLNVLVFLLTMHDLDGAAVSLGAVASQFTGLPPELPSELQGVLEIPPTPSPWIRLFTHMFVHGSLLHLLGNMWFLWVFGDNVEDRLGPSRFLLLYFLGGMAALGAQIISAPASGLPVVGASGAISAILGGYLVLYPHAEVLTLVPFGFLPVLITLPAALFLLLWLALQVLGGLATAGSTGIAWWAHIGGFALGAALIRPLSPRRRRRIQVELGP